MFMPFFYVLIKHQQDVFSLSLQELMLLKIVTASNIYKKLIDAPAAIVVISAEDIQQPRRLNRTGR
ncbi:MAG: hypothetical protein HRU20_07065 [Pseudomonadales bacterium]|nr:hypothetical protein [Pseudomonadales bacterium]